MVLRRQILINLCLLNIFAATVSSGYVNYVTARRYHTSGGYNYGSIAGGTLLWIRGSGFRQTEIGTFPFESSPYLIQLRNGNNLFNCTSSNEPIISTSMSCYTPPLPAGYYDVFVYLDGELLARNPSSTTFWSHAYYTPIISGITPTLAVSQKLITLTGDFKVNSFSQETENIWGDATPRVSRVYIGTAACNLINPETNDLYPMSAYSIQCLNDNDQVGIFNVSVIVTDTFGRSMTSDSLYRLSATGQLYTVESHAIVSNISPKNGSAQGGTVITITGDYFSHSTRNPLIVNIADRPCTIVNVSQTTIQCETSSISSFSDTHHHGGLGWHLFTENFSTNLNNMNISSLPMPSINANQSWISQAKVSLYSGSSTTVWMIGYIRSPINATYIFKLETNVNSHLYLSTDDDPMNMIQIANQSSLSSKSVVLQNNKSYYMLCIASVTSGTVSLSIKATILDVDATRITNDNLAKSIQSISVGAAPVSEHVRISYTQSPNLDGVPEIQDIFVYADAFQIGFRGVFSAVIDGAPTTDYVQRALNSLPTIYPKQVAVTLQYDSYRVTFPSEMGDVPPFTIISPSFSSPRNAAEIQKGVSASSESVVELDGATSRYMDFTSSNFNWQVFQNEFTKLFFIKCPASLYDQEFDSSIVYANDFEVNGSPNVGYKVADLAFCGKDSITHGYLVTNNLQPADYVCFAYKMTNGTSAQIRLHVQSDGDSPINRNEYISFSPITDNRWHYTCLNFIDELESHDPIYATVTSFLISNIQVITYYGAVRFDTVSLRTSLPEGYEEQYYISISDQSSVNGGCSFPFLYQGQQFYKCILDDDQLPFCMSSANQKLFCESSSIEGVRRFIPKYPLLPYSLTAIHDSANQKLDVFFRYTDCATPSLIKIHPSTNGNVTSITKASQPIGGTYGITFKNRTYMAIPAVTAVTELKNLFESFPDFGYVSISKSGECAQYSYTIEWLSRGPQPLISIANTSALIPTGSPANVSLIQNGTFQNQYYMLPIDLMRTYHTTSQVEVLVNGHPSFCDAENNSCEFYYSFQQTPTISSIQYNRTTLVIQGTGFQSSNQMNTVFIGEEYTCSITTVTTSSITCTLMDLPCGVYPVRVKVEEKGFATSNTSLTINIGLFLTSFTPSQGSMGGGYNLTVIGRGFSANTRVYIGNNPCFNTEYVGTTSLVCTVPPSTSTNASQVRVSLVDNTYSANTSSLFTYNTSNTPIIFGVQPSVVSVAGDVITINGTGFGNGSIRVYVNDTPVSVVSSSNTHIQVNLTSLPPGRYPVTVKTSIGFARPLIYIEYRFSIQSISPQIGSLHGGVHVYVQGEGFNNGTLIDFRSESNQRYPCKILSSTSTLIHCQTSSSVERLSLVPTGTHPTYGFGFTWSSSHLFVSRGTIVTWEWSELSRPEPLSYRIQQLASAVDTQPLNNGFDSGPATLTGTFSYQFNTPGIYHYWSPNPTGGNMASSIRGVIEVVTSLSKSLTVEATWKNFTAETCAFPFTFNEQNYTECTRSNDTQLWCSPTSIYTGQRFYCEFTASVLASNCSFDSINGSVCDQVVPTVVRPTQYLPTLCNVPSITSISPTSGTFDTDLTITGDGFSGQMCQYDVEIGSSYHCPIITMTSNQIVCRIGIRSLIDATVNHTIRVSRRNQGYFGIDDGIRFTFLPSITSISPMIGSIFDGTEVTIEGDGFKRGQTLVMIGYTPYYRFTNITYSRIIFTTNFNNTPIDQNLTVTVFVGGNTALCRMASCSFVRSTAITSYLYSVFPTSISGPTNLIFNGSNLLAGENISNTDIQLSINGHLCQVTNLTNTSIRCSISDVEAGTYSISGSIQGVGKIGMSLTLFAQGVILNVSPRISSIYGGAIMIIQGYGFRNNISQNIVTVGSNRCRLISATYTELRCVIPAQNSSSNPAAIEISSEVGIFTPVIFLNYTENLTPTIVSANATSSNSRPIFLHIVGDRFISNQTSVRVGDLPCSILNMTSTLIACIINNNQSAGSHAIVVNVASIGDSNANITYDQSLSVTSLSSNQGGYGGGLAVNITGDGFLADNVTIDVCNRTCMMIKVISNTELICITPAFNVSEINDTCRLTVTVNGMSAYQSFTYRTNLTATVTSISPYRGGTGGGTTVTINGTNFPLSADAAIVTIAGAPCTIKNISRTSIICETSSSPETNLEAPVKVLINGNGYATGTFTFQYIDLWSSRWTWGGEEPPDVGSLVVINNGVKIFLDMSTPILKVLLIDNASLIFDDTNDITLNVEYILILNGGHLQVGTASKPFQHHGGIKIYGHLRSIELPLFGAKVLALRNGTLDMHGKSTVKTWTHLASTVDNGSSIIHLIQPVDWSINSEIVIGTTGDRFSQKESELCRIVNISSDNMTLTLDRPLKYSHLGLSRQINTTMIDVRAEVGLLTHNVIFEGSVTETWNDTIPECPDGFNPDENAVQTCFLGRYGEEIGSDDMGALLVVSSGQNSSSVQQSVIMRLSNVEIFNVGQTFRMNRFAINFDQNWNMSLSYIKSSSIHLSFNRAINIQNTHSITFEDNVIYNIMGNAVFLKDGVETGHVFRNNLVMFVKATSTMMNEDVTPAAFWLTNPNNILENNAVVGCTHYGYWYRLFNQPARSSINFYPNVDPSSAQFGSFLNNKVHSTGRYGVWIYPKYSPSTSGVGVGAIPQQAVIDGLIAWQNDKGIEYVMSRTIQIKNALLFDNANTNMACIKAIYHQETNPYNLRPTFYNVENGSSIIDSIIIGTSQIWTVSSVKPSTAGLVVMWDRGLRVKNVTFINFISNQTKAIYGPVIPGVCTTRCGGWLTKFSNISFINVEVRGAFRWLYDGLYEDEDGSLGGIDNSIIMPPDTLNNDSSCSAVPAFSNAMRCSLSSGPFVRMGLKESYYYYYPGYPFLRNTLTMTDQNSRSISINMSSSEDFTHPNGYVMVLRVNQTYTFISSDTPTWFNVRYSSIIYDLSPGDYLIIQHYTPMTPTYAFQKNGSLTSLSGETNSHQDWYYNSTTSLFSYIIKNPVNNSGQRDMTVLFYMHQCPRSDCAPEPTYPPPGPPGPPPTSLPYPYNPGYQTLNQAQCDFNDIRYWSNDSHWTFGPQSYSNSYGTKPGDNVNIFIPRCIRLIIDCALPRIRSLRIDGILIFQQGMDHTMYVDSIFISGGQLIAGSTSNVFTNKIDIILTGTGPSDIDLPNNFPTREPRMIAVLGLLDLRGISHTVTWTRLASSANAGDLLLNLSEPVDWNVGDEIVITTTDVSLRQTERHTIAAIDNNITIRLIQPLAYNHVVLRQQFSSGRQLNIAAAVGLLTRNIRIINHNPSSALSGVRILLTNCWINAYFVEFNRTYLAYYEGFARLSNVQFMGFGKFDDSPSADRSASIFLENLGDFDSTRPTYIDSCSFDGGFNAAVATTGTNAMTISNNVIYNTYRSAIVITGRNNNIIKNLVTTVHWSGSAQTESVAEFNQNYDGAIMSRSAISVVMQNNLIAGVERLGYRINGAACVGAPNANGISNDFVNNEVHSAMSGVNVWPQDRGFTYDRECVLIKGFTTYKAWYYGFYINTQRNITIDSCTSVDSDVGIFTFIIAPSAVRHVMVNSRVTIQNTVVIGAVTPNDCENKIDTTSRNVRFADKAVPMVAVNETTKKSLGRAGIVFPTVSRLNNMPLRPWTGITSYPSLSGEMIIRNSTLAYFNDICARHDTAIQVSQSNDDGQFPVTTSSIEKFNVSDQNIIFNGLPNLDKVTPRDCVDMDCDGLKKSLLRDTDGTLLNHIGTAISHAEALWGSQSHGIGDFRIPKVAIANLTGHRINVNLTYPYRGISRHNACVLQPAWNMYRCNGSDDHRMLIIESMDSDSETRRLSPVALLSRTGYIDLMNGPQDHGLTSSYTSRKRLSTFMSIVRSGETYEFYFSTTAPKTTRFRIINSDALVKCVLAFYIGSLQQIDVYINGMYIPPTNRDLTSAPLRLLNQSNGVNISSPAGSNYFDRDYQTVYFAIDGTATIDVKIAPMLIISFNLPPMDPSQFYTGDIVAKLAALFNIPPNKIRTVKIVSASSGRRRRRQLAPLSITIEMRDEPRSSSSSTGSVQGEILANIAASIINRYQTNELQTSWVALNISGNTAPISSFVQEPLDQSWSNLSVINRTELRVAPDGCRQQSPCTIQPVLIAYDAQGNVIDKLGSIEKPWQVKATLVNRPNLVLPGSIANYSNGQTQFSTFALPDLGSYQIQFTFLTPDGVSSTFVQTANLTARTPPLNVTKAVLGGQQVDGIYRVFVNQTFDISLIPVDKETGKPLANIQWSSNWTWKANASLYSLPAFNRPGALIPINSSTNISLSTGRVKLTSLSLDTVGMYILNLGLLSTDGEYSIKFPSNAILVYDDSDDFVNDTESYACNITFDGDFDQLNSSGQLEVTRAMVYNYLISVGMPLISDITLVKGSVVALFQVGTSASAVAQSTAAIQANTSAIPNLRILSVNINGRSYSPTSASSSSSGSSSSSSSSGDDEKKKTSSQEASNNGMIIGIVVGVVVVVLIIGTLIGLRIHKVVKNGHQPMLEADFDGELSETNYESRPVTPIVISPPPPPVEEEVTVSPVMENPETTVNRIDSAPIFSSRSRSVSLDLDVIDCEANQDEDNSSMNRPAIEFQLIDFD